MKVIVNGAQGKMGALAAKTIQQHPDFELVAELGKSDNLEQTIAKTKANIVIDLTRADCVYGNSLTIIKSGAHPVIGTSGLKPQQIQNLCELCKERNLGGIIAPNFSVSAVLMIRFAAMAAKYLPNVEIIEAHHPQKFDAPSGTAIKTAEMISQARTQKPGESHGANSKARGELFNDVPIHAIRLPGILARQDVLFGSLGETLSIQHNSIDRASFMPGIILCCQKVSQFKQLYYGLEHAMDD